MLRSQIALILSLFILSSCKIGGPGGKSISGGGGGNLPTSQTIMDMVKAKLDPALYCEVYVGQGDSKNREQKFFTPIIPKNGNNDYKEEWSNHIIDKIDSNPKLKEKFLQTDDLISKKELDRLGCPGFAHASENERKMFWALFFASIAYPESSYNTNSVYRETNNTDSAGLLQIDSARANDQCRDRTGINYTTSSLTGKPKENLECGLWILYDQFDGKLKANRQTVNGKRRNKWLFPPDNSGVSYWSVLRNGRNGQAKLFKHFKAHSVQLTFCQISDKQGKRNAGKMGEQGATDTECDKLLNSPRGTPEPGTEGTETGGAGLNTLFRQL